MSVRSHLVRARNGCGVRAASAGGPAGAGWVWRELEAGEAVLAWPLVMATGRPMDPAAWRAFVERWLAGGGTADRGLGVLTARNGTIVGLVLWGREPSDPHRLEVPVLRALEMTTRVRTLLALFGALETVARELGCREVRLDPAGDPAGGDDVDERLAAAAEELDLLRDGGVWRHELAAPQEAAPAPQGPA